MKLFSGLPDYLYKANLAWMYLIFDQLKEKTNLKHLLIKGSELKQAIIYIFWPYLDMSVNTCIHKW